MDLTGLSHAAVGFQPVDDNVLLRLVAPKGPSSKETVEWGDVVAVGPGRRMSDGTLIALDLTPGDRVALRPGSAMLLSLHGQSFAIVGGSAVLGVLLPGVAIKYPPQSAGAMVDESQQESPDLVTAEAPAEESLETDVAPDLLDREAPTGEDLH